MMGIKDSDQSRFQLSLFSDFAVHIKKAWVLSNLAEYIAKTDHTRHFFWITLILFVLLCKGERFQDYS